MRRRLLVTAAFCGLTVFPLFAAAGAGPATTTQKARAYLISRYQQALAIDPDYLPLHYFLGITLLVDGQDVPAVAELSRAYPAYTDSVEMHYNLGLAYARTGDPDSALLYLERAEELGALAQPELYPLADAYFNLGLAYREAGNLDDAEGLFSRVLAIDPRRHEVHRLRGDLFARQGDTEKALEEFCYYLQAHPEDPTVREYLFSLHYNRALQLFERNDSTAARATFEQALAVAPGSPLALYYLGYLDYAAGDLDSAIKRLTAAAPDAPETVAESISGLLYNCALTLLEQRKSTQALRAIAPLLERGGGSAKALFLAGNIHLARREFVQARDYYRRLLDVDPAHRGAVANLIAADAGAVEELFEQGRELSHSGDLGAAISRLEAALAINPADVRVADYARQVREALNEQASTLLATAAAALQSGQPRAALAPVRQALQLQPGSARGRALEAQVGAALADEAAAALAEGRQALAANHLADAEAAFDRILEVDPESAEARTGKQQVATRRLEQVTATLALGSQALAEGRLIVARKAFSEVLQWLPQQSEALTGLAQVDAQLEAAATRELQAGRQAMDAGRFKEALAHFADALALRDDPAIREELAATDQALSAKRDALLEAARQALTDGDFKLAHDLYAQVLQLFPEEESAHQGLSELELATTAAVGLELAAAERDLAAGNWRGALTHYRQILDIAPANPQALRGLETGREKLRGQLSQLVARGSELLTKGELSSAEVTFQKALELDPYQREALAAVKRIAQLKSVGIRPGDQQRLYLQGIEYYTRGRYDQAVAAWEQVLLLSPGHEKARMNIEKARRKLNQIKEYSSG